MLKLFFWKVFLCVVPFLMALSVVAYAWQNDTFKLGVDLVGGTILVYEIDTRKLQADSQNKQSAQDIAKNLAEKLKQRIDPNDLYNVVIRPAGGEGRVEIILPTGGKMTHDEHQKQWNAVLEEMEKFYGLPPKFLKVPRGQVQKLADKILQYKQESSWEKQLFNTAQSKQKLMEGALDPLKEEQALRPLFDLFLSEWQQRIKRATAAFGAAWGGPLFVAPYVGTDKVEGYAAGRVLNRYDPATKTLKFDYKASLADLIKEVKDCVDDNRKSREIDGWFKQQAWRKVIGMVLEKWPVLKDRKAAFEKIAPDAVDELVGRVECKGDGVGQAFLTVLEPLVGKDVLQSRYADDIELDDKGKAKDDSKFINPNTVLKFVEENYGPSPQQVERKIDSVYKPDGRTRDPTVEEVQRIKDLVSKVGSLEFRILANSVDDKAAIDDAKDMINKADESPSLKTELEYDQKNGLPPPAPREGDTKEPKVYTIKLRGGDCKVSYSWVELGPQERKSLGLNNNVLQERDMEVLRGGGGQSWSYLNSRRRQAVQIPLVGSDSSDRKMLQGALFYSRECQDVNLPEEERRRKKYEYFVLTRNPEVGTAKIDGRYLKNAANQPGNDGRPAVSFVFDNTGAALFGDVTRKNVPTGEESGRDFKRHLAIILDGLIMSAPTINSEIREHGQISGDFSNRDVDQLVNVLRAGALPATLKPQPVSENTMGATLGEDTTNRGLIAISVAFVVVLVFMVVYYRFAGLVASVALLANLVLTVGFMVAVKATFTLPGLAGLVLMLGMAVDANILIYERLREERDRGASILLALRNGYDRAFGTIIDTHLTSIFTAVVLYIVGNDQLKGFGVTLTVGLLISLYTSLFVTRVIFDLWAAMGWLKKLSMFRFFTRPDIDFMSIRYYLFAATGILTVLGGALFIGRLPDDLNIDFVGGTAYSGQLIESKAKTIEELRDMFTEKNQEDRLKAHADEIDEKANRYEVWYEDGKGKESPKRSVALANRPDADTPQKRAEMVARRASNMDDDGNRRDVTVEQIFLSSDPETDTSKSRYFTVRSTEKEPEIVQATLDRLLQYKDEKSGDWKPLLKKVLMTYDLAELESKQGGETKVQFFDSTPDGKAGNPVAASPSFVTTLLTRELMNAFGVTERQQLPFTFELVGDDDDPSGDGRFKKALLSFTPKETSLSTMEVSKIKQALDKACSEFRDRPQPERLETFDSQLAAETRLRAMYAILLSWAAILLYLWGRFGSWTFGLAAVLCLIHDLFFTLGAIAICHYVNKVFPGVMGIEDFKIDLPAVASLLTLVGYSVNDTIVVFDRIREVRGKNPDLTAQMINDSVNQTLSRTLLSSLTTWLVVIVLYVWGGPGVHLFAFVMVVGVVVGTYSSIYVASPLLLLFGEGGRSAVKGQSGGPAPIQREPDVRIQPAVS